MYCVVSICIYSKMSIYQLNYTHEYPLYYNCYECGYVPAKHIDIMQKYDCVVCEGRKCSLHSVINENIRCNICLKDKLCNDCRAFGRCCGQLSN